MARTTRFKTKYGYLTQDGKEYVITTPRTPRPWANVVSNGDAGFVISQTGGGYSWRGNAQMNRLTRWEQDVLKDEWGKYLFVRDHETGRFWSAAWKPVMREPDRYEVRHGIGYSVITSVNEGIETEWRLFVAPDDPVELWRVTVRNLSRRSRRITLMSFFEWGLGAAPDWHREFHKCFTKTEYDPPLHAILATKRLWEIPSKDGHWNTDWKYVAFHAANVRPSGFDCSKESFLGTYGQVSSPAAVKAGKLKGNSGDWLDPVGCLSVEMTLGSGRERTVCFSLGAADDRDHASALIRKFQDLSDVDRTMLLVKERWTDLLGRLVVTTPEPAMNVMLNTWLKYQAVSGRLWGRTGYYQAGGAYGFRDQLQDSQIFLPLEPAYTLRQILLHARHQFKDGTVHHWWHPLSEVGHPTAMTDDLLWLPFVVHAFIDETGDLSVLDRREPFLDDPSGASIAEHCVRAIDKVLDRFSPRGLPLIGAGDWNDGISAAGLGMKGESVWLGEFLYLVLRQTAGDLEAHGDGDLARRYRERAEMLREAVNEQGWDGSWYYYGTKDSGEKFGSRENAEGWIHLNPQTWAVIGGVADEDRAGTVMDMVKEHLEFRAGPLLLFPAYKTPDPKIGYLTRYAAGTRENGAVYSHAATWAVIAMARLKRSKDAYRLFSKINPLHRGMKPDEYCAEPYVTAGNIDGPDSRFYGRGGWTWYSGSAAWLFRAGLDWILGIRASRDGLVVDPCIPAEWPGFSVTRQFRGASYAIEVRNPDRVECGVKQVLIDGTTVSARVEGTGVILPVFPTGATHAVQIILGVR